MAKAVYEKQIEALKALYEAGKAEADKKAEAEAKQAARVEAAEAEYNKAMADFSAAAENYDIVTYKETREKMSDAEAIYEFEKKKLAQIREAQVISRDECKAKVAEAVDIMRKGVQAGIKDLAERLDEIAKQRALCGEMLDTGNNLLRLYQRDLAGIIPKRPTFSEANKEIKYNGSSDQEARDLTGELEQLANSYFRKHYGQPEEVNSKSSLRFFK